MSLLPLICLFLSSSIWLCLANEPVGFSVDTVQSYTLLNKSHFGATLYSLNLSNQTYLSGPPLLINLYGNRYEQGYDYGVLLGAASNESYYSFLTSLIGDEWYTSTVIKALGILLDWQWNDFLSKQTPHEYMEELAGLKAGGLAVGVKDLDKIITRVITFANFPGDLSDFVYVLQDEYDRNHRVSFSRLLGEESWKTVQNFLIERRKTEEKNGKASSLHCSMFAVWGQRTSNSALFTARNLDWVIDTGINKYKLITVYHLPGGKRSHATIGFAGVLGCINWYQPIPFDCS